MKLLFVALLMMFGFSGEVFATKDFEFINEGGQAVYVPTSDVWNTGCMAEDRIVLTRSVSAGSGNFSVYSNDKQSFQLSSNLEFIADERLIGYNSNSLKFTKVVYKEHKFQEEPLSDDELSQIFDDAILVALTVPQTVVPAGKKILFLNHGDKTFYHYDFEPKIDIHPYIKSIVQFKTGESVRFSHFGEDSALYPAVNFVVSE